MKGLVSNPAERRRSPRIRLQIPVFVRGTDCNGRETLELSRAVDISTCGALITLEKQLDPQRVVVLTIPSPPPSRTGLIPAETPPIAAHVRRQHAAGDFFFLGLEFLKPLE